MSHQSISGAHRPPVKRSAVPQVLALMAEKIPIGEHVMKMNYYVVGTNDKAAATAFDTALFSVSGLQCAHPQTG